MDHLKRYLYGFAFASAFCIGTYHLTIKPLITKQIKEEFYRQVEGSLESNTQFPKEALDKILLDESFISEPLEKNMDTKLGFEYSSENKAKILKLENSYADTQRPYFGVEYDFKIINRFPEGTQFELIMKCINPKKGNNTIFLRDYDFDGKPDWVSVYDTNNNYSTTIVRKQFGRLEFESNSSEQAAKDIYAFVTMEYQTFMSEHNILDKIADYSPTLELTVQKPNLEE